MSFGEGVNPRPVPEPCPTCGELDPADHVETSFCQTCKPMPPDPERELHSLAEARKIIAQEDPPVPAEGEWPCQADPHPPRPLPSRLVTFLYLLLRQEVLPGDLEDLAIQAGKIEGEPVFTNPHLEDYARALTNHLTQGETFPYSEAP